ncbi:hypothetical protein ASE86_00675 [Sphingomonas sp. Leaf33]|uniref:hypothetical protein n=1 Tax=Sphingomonas sp. Leaf33 TaxID=1736215 RepID=UPI0006F4A42F|nr:hypothetical protein [Sphingomonas sp. Leaf33]KQN24844.1 hypothetical protein ASE86_00675 [Sphingomonas sp. Leaf33]
MRSMIAVVLTASLTACGAAPVERTAPPPPPATPTPTPTATQPAATQPVVAVDEEGLRLVDRLSGRTRPIPFGTSRSDTLAALARRGSPDVGTNAECGAGPLGFARYRDGLMLQFQDDRFAGWSVDRTARGTVTTMAGIGPGSTRAALKSAYAITLPDSTLGTEFAAGAMGGLLDGPGPQARITDLWAGVTCLFR